jgi:hypothetical protein
MGRSRDRTPPLLEARIEQGEMLLRSGPRLTEKLLYVTFAMPWRRPKIPNKVE